MFAIAGYLVASAEATLLSVFSDERADTVAQILEQADIRRAAENSLDLLVVLQHDRHLLEVHAIEAMAVGIAELDGVVL